MAEYVTDAAFAAVGVTVYVTFWHACGVEPVVDPLPDFQVPTNGVIASDPAVGDVGAEVEDGSIEQPAAATPTSNAEKKRRIL